MILKNRIKLLASVSFMLFFGSGVYAEINFSRLFLKNSEEQNLSGYYLLAQYESDENSLFLAVHAEDNSYKLFEMGVPAVLQELQLTAVEFDGERLELKDEVGATYFLSFISEITEKIKPMDSKLKDKVMVLKSMDNANTLKIFKDVANLLGVPDFITAQFSSLPKQGRTNAGRPGWVLDETIPKILLLTSPFKPNDIIVTIDGIAIKNINKLKQNLSKKNNADYFDVEIQRGGNLKMIRVRL